MTIRIAVLIALILSSVQAIAVGPPDYIPNGPHPRIFLNASKIAELQAAQAANSTDWQTLSSWCEANKNITGYDAPIGTSGFGNFPLGAGYRGDGWATHIINYSLAYKILNGIDQVKADEYASRAVLLATNMLRGASVGEETNGLVIIRMTDVNDRTVNAAEATALQAQNPNLLAMGSKNGYGIRNSVFAIAIAYDWLYEKLDATQKINFQSYIYRSIDWVNGKRSKYNNGVLYNNVRYYEDTDGPCTGTTDAGETISCTTVARTAKDPYQFGFAYNDPGDNFWSGFFLAGMLGTIATYGDNVDAAAYYSYVKGTWWEGMLKTRWADPMHYKGGDPSEGWNYGWGLFREIWALRALETATGESVFYGVDFPREAAQAYMHSTASNLTNMPPTGDWGSANRGKVGYSHIFNLTSLLQHLGDSLAPVANRYLKEATYYATTNAASLPVWQKLIFNVSDTEEPLSTLPLYYASVGAGTISMRNSWENAADSIHAEFIMKKDIPGMSHDNYDAGHFYIQRGDDVLFLDSNGHEPYRHSTIYFGTKGQQAYSEVGAQSPALSRVKSDTNYLYFKGDLTRAYVRDSSISYPGAITRHASNYIKSVLYIRPNIWIINDITQSGPQADSLAKTWYTQYPVNSTTGLDVDLDSRTITSTVGASKAWVKTLYPTNTTFTVDTQPGYAAMGRVAEVTQTVKEYDQFLHVIEATGNTGTQTPASLIEGTGGRGALVGTTAAMFSNDPDGGSISDIAYTTNATTHYIADLPTSSNVEVFRGGVSLGTFNTGSSGIVTFSATAGEATYTIGEPSCGTDATLCASESECTTAWPAYHFCSGVCQVTECPAVGSTAPTAFRIPGGAPYGIVQ